MCSRDALLTFLGNQSTPSLVGLGFPNPANNSVRPTGASSFSVLTYNKRLINADVIHFGPSITDVFSLPSFPPSLLLHLSRGWRTFVALLVSEPAALASNSRMITRGSKTSLPRSFLAEPSISDRRAVKGGDGDGERFRRYNIHD